MLQKGAEVWDESGNKVDADAREELARTVSVVWGAGSWVVYGIA
jgi:hypothetical protein